MMTMMMIINVLTTAQDMAYIASMPTRTHFIPYLLHDIIVYVPAVPVLGLL